MKKYIKFLIIALFVVAAVTVTCYLFFNKLNKSKEAEVSLVEVYQGSVRKDYNKYLDETIEIINSDKTDNRFEIMKATLSNLDSSMRFIASYYVESNGVVKSKEIAEVVSTFNSSTSLANSMMNEIKIKAFLRDEENNIIGDNSFYKRHLGANDLYKCVASQLVNYANLIKEASNNLDVPKTIDIRFSIVELYADAVIKAFSEVALGEDNWYYVVNTNTMNLFNSSIKWNGLMIETEYDIFNTDNTNFVKHYNLCNKSELVNNFYEMYQNIDSVVNPTSEQYVVIYFKEVFGL